MFPYSVYRDDRYRFMAIYDEFQTFFKNHAQFCHLPLLNSERTSFIVHCDNRYRFMTIYNKFQTFFKILSTLALSHYLIVKGHFSWAFHQLIFPLSYRLRCNESVTPWAFFHAFFACPTTFYPLPFLNSEGTNPISATRTTKCSNKSVQMTNRKHPAIRGGNVQ